MSKIAVAVINRKGGVGKTTIALILTEIALVRQNKVLAIDLDTQRNFTDGLTLIRNSFKNSLRIKDDLSKNDGDAPEDWIIIDCPPEMGPKSLEAMEFADIVLVPVKPDLFSLSNLNLVYTLARRRGKGPHQLPIIKVGYQKSKISKLLEGILEDTKYPVVSELPLHKLIPYNIASGRIWSMGLTSWSRKPYVDMFEKIERAYEKLKAGDLEDVWLPPEKLEIDENSDSEQIEDEENDDISLDSVPTLPPINFANTEPEIVNEAKEAEELEKAEQVLELVSQTETAAGDILEVVSIVAPVEEVAEPLPDETTIEEASEPVIESEPVENSEPITEDTPIDENLEPLAEETAIEEASEPVVENEPVENLEPTTEDTPIDENLEPLPDETSVEEASEPVVESEPVENLEPITEDAPIDENLEPLPDETPVEEASEPVVESEPVENLEPITEDATVDENLEPLPDETTIEENLDPKSEIDSVEEILEHVDEIEPIEELQEAEADAEEAAEIPEIEGDTDIEQELEEEQKTKPEIEPEK